MRLSHLVVLAGFAGSAFGQTVHLVGTYGPVLSNPSNLPTMAVTAGGFDITFLISNNQWLNNTYSVNNTFFNVVYSTWIMHSFSVPSAGFARLMPPVVE